ncbi:putative INO80 chromatin remodeling complex (Ies1) [Aspergillus lucknowensis]|uniref:INO80 chromatin remodeling complex Ies1 n=1 Tax=Aspergillus lucknowensis TaxID=176173 RepID=A0ABR4LTV4_9EURO
MADIETAGADDSFAQSETHDEQPIHNMTVGTRRQPNGTIGSVYSGNKIRHLKKEDGIPLWRKDIQHQFLKLVFEDKTPVFTRWPDGQKNLDFADIYIDAMARSSKTSKILKDKLQSDKQAAISMAMVCLLVNFGRMNTTLNFFPEMRAQLRTYHSIPSLQAHQDPNAYKQLQDAPRLKSILKGASEDVDQPNTLEKIKREKVPRTNPVNLIFVLAQYAPKVSEMHFFPPRDFFDLVMRSTLSSQSRAKAFLWLMWWYLESDFSREAALNNPFGPGLEGEGTGGLPVKVPAFQILTEEQANAENIDTQSEIEYGEVKRLERKRILEEDEPTPRAPKRSKKMPYWEFQYLKQMEPGTKISLRQFNNKGEAFRAAADSDDLIEFRNPDGTIRSTVKMPRDEDYGYQAGSLDGPSPRLVLKTKAEQTPDAASPAPPGSGHPVLNRFITEASPNHQGSSRRPRPLTQHQLAVERNRRQRIEYILAKRKSDAYRVLRQKRENEIPFARYGRLLQNLPDGYDTDDEKSWGKAGILPNPEEEEDFGECASYFLSVIRKASRRLDRWDHENANGPRRDRKKEREERQKAREEAMDIEDVIEGKLSSRSRARAQRNAKRKLARVAAAASTPAGAISKASTSRSKGNPGQDQRDGRGAGSATLSADNAGLDTPSRDEALSPAAGDIEGEEGLEGLDDIDRELLGENSGDEDAMPRGAQALRSAGPGYDDSFLGGDGDEDADALSSDEEDEDAEDEELDEADVDMEVEGDADENSSIHDGGERDAASEVSGADDRPGWA